MKYLRRNRKVKNIRNPESRNARLMERAKRGKDAEIIASFAIETLGDAQDYALSRLATATQEELIMVQADYKAAIAFYQKIQATIAIGIEASRKLNKKEE